MSTETPEKKEATVVLLGCPFCGSANIALYERYHPRCTDCGAIQEKVSGTNGIDAWNTRAT